MKRISFGKYIICLLLSSLMGLCACSKFLDAKLASNLAVPNSIADYQSLLDASININYGTFPALLEMGSDDYYISAVAYNGMTEFDRDNYIWAPEPFYLLVNSNLNWKNSFMPILYANLVLERLDKADGDEAKKAELKGWAQFVRGFSFYHLAQVYCEPYKFGTANIGLGLPLRNTADYNVPSIRSSLQETYEFVIGDLKAAAALLPQKSEYKTRPNKQAAFAALARCYLTMQDYENAYLYADSALSLDATLIDYNQINAAATLPFSRFNAETIYFSYSNGSALFNPSRARISKDLVELYSEKDIRRKAFFNVLATGEYSFKGAYHGSAANTFFMGLTTAELYLIKAESAVRIGREGESRALINALLKNRIDKVRFVALESQDRDVLLNLILKERRKELLFRGIRWTDLRRLNMDTRYAKTLKRIWDKTEGMPIAELPPNDHRYTYLIPQEVIQITGMQQNRR